MKLAIAGLGYVGMSNAGPLVQHNRGVAVTIADVAGEVVACDLFDPDG